MKSVPFMWRFKPNLAASVAIDGLEYAEYPVDEALKWEKRFFWPEDHTVEIYGLSQDLTHPEVYKYKSREDIYILDSTSDLNIKIRKEKIAIKPLVKTQDKTFGYAKKIKYSKPYQDKGLLEQLPVLKDWHGQPLSQYLSQWYALITVDKEAYIYKLDANLKAKIEFSKITIHNQRYLSLCIEAKNKTLVQDLAKRVVPGAQPQDYIQFIRSIL